MTSISAFIADADTITFSGVSRAPYRPFMYSASVARSSWMPALGW